MEGGEVKAPGSVRKKKCLPYAEDRQPPEGRREVGNFGA